MFRVYSPQTVSDVCDTETCEWNIPVCVCGHLYFCQLHRVHIFILSFIIGVSQDNKHFVEIKYSVFKTKLFVNRPVMFNLIQDGLVSQT